jgi:PAS domain S-box-containing protein
LDTEEADNVSDKGGLNLRERALQCTGMVGRALVQVILQPLEGYKMIESGNDISLQSKLVLLEAITDAISENILLLSKDYKILWANKAAMTQSGLILNDIVGNYCYAITHNRETPCEQPNDSCPVSDLLATGNSKTVQHIHVNKDGDKSFVEINVYPVKDNTGETVELVHISKDITERVMMEKEIAEKVVQLEESLARVKQLEGIIPICMYCKKIRDDEKMWHQLEEYITRHSEATFSHGVCPECYKKQLGEILTIQEK